MKTWISFLLIVVCIATNNAQQTVRTNLVTLNSNGTLTYTKDTQGNTIIDHGMVGYMQGRVAIPNVPVKVTLTPRSGDRTQDIQNAINQVQAMPVDGNGHRGTILLKRGTYLVSSQLSISQSGVVIRGEGSGTNGSVIKHTSKNKDIIINIETTEAVSNLTNTRKNITDSYVPYGAKTISVESGHGYRVGQTITVTRVPNDKWTADLGMDDLLGDCGAGHNNWTAANYDISTRHKIINVSGNRLTLDVPLNDQIGPPYSTGYVQQSNWVGLTQCGVESLRIEARDGASNLETHAKRAVYMKNVADSWVRDVKAKDLINNCVKVTRCYQITVSNCEMVNYQSKVTGGRRYGFSIDKSQLILIKDCKSHNGRHCFALGSKTAGPNVVINGRSTNAKADIGPHHRWGTGALWENIKTDGPLNLQLRKCSGSGHGWAASQNTLWNCTAKDMAVHQPLRNYHQNYAIGCTGNVTNRGFSTAPLGYVERTNNPVEFSLYEYQALNYHRSQIDCTTTNVAKGKATSQSSNYNSRFTANIATDGSSSSNNFTHTKKEKNAWLQIDLGESFDISEIKITNRQNCCSDRLNDFHILVSDKPFNTTDLRTTRYHSDVSDYHFPGKAKIITNAIINRSGRYVRIQLSGSDYLSLSEVEVMACNNGNLPPATATDCDWKKLSGKGLDIGSGGGKTFLVGTNNRVYEWNGTGWSIKAQGPRAARIDVTGAGIPWITATDGKIYYLQGNSWKKVSGWASDVGCNKDKVWVIGGGGRVYRWNGGDNWSNIGGKTGTRIDVYSDGNPFIIGMDNKVYQRLNNGQWAAKGNLKAKEIGISQSGDKIIAIETNDNIHQYEGNGQWRKLPGTARHTTVDSNGNGWIINAGRDIFTQECKGARLHNNDIASQLGDIRETEVQNTPEPILTDIKVYPNPASSFINIDVTDYNSENFNLIISNIDGAQIMSQSYDSNRPDKLIINIDEYTNGTYLLYVLSKDHDVIVKKIVVLK